MRVRFFLLAASLFVPLGCTPAEDKGDDDDDDWFDGDESDADTDADSDTDTDSDTDADTDADADADADADVDADVPDDPEDPPLEEGAFSGNISLFFVSESAAAVANCEGVSELVVDHEVSPPISGRAVCEFSDTFLDVNRVDLMLDGYLGGGEIEGTTVLYMGDAVMDGAWSGWSEGEGMGGDVDGWDIYEGAEVSWEGNFEAWLD